MEWFVGFWILVGIFVGWCWYSREKSSSSSDVTMEQKSGVLPKGSFGWPLIGETLDFIAAGYTSQPVSFMEKRRSLYGKVFKTHILGTPIIVSTDPAVNKVVLQNHGNIFIPAYPKSIREIFGEYSILQTNGTLQKKVHALIGGFLRSPQFKTRITKDIEHHVKLTLTSWKDRPLLLIQEETQKFTFKVLVKALLSLDPSDDLDFLKREFDEFIKGLICLPIKLPGTRLYKSLKAKERIFKLVKKIVEQRKLGLEKSEDQEHQNTIPNDAVDVLLRDISGEQNDKQSLSLDFIISHIIELMIPGEETVPMSMTLAVKFLSDCPVALELLTEENMKLKRQKTDSGDDYCWTDYMSLQFTQNVSNKC
ncbi:3-epi-6-deoxocathasterone 23-monooxygenase CYP90C1 [Populus alba x Populus x berolinensis]|uniref:3-epi-6-deoxocathasterone 23-monooxygenase CYP90C1 n=1 Tax=Populus alba x Populus x berolinensis TaxID=444605 RepID=A0AAD6QGE9_9ROSI|nr:3-epi-6-deoxocathasterone 23-monooxygenase CYP90C1 [Populus alba x Populus x berolinensis]